MNLQIDKNLYDERYYGGFEPTDPDDETFILEKIDEYPGTLPFETKGLESENLDFLSESEQNPEIPTTLQSYQITNQEELIEKEIATYEEKDFEQKEVLPKIGREQFEKVGKEERVPIPYEKSGIEKLEKEVLPYEKAGLIENEEVTTFKKTPKETIQKDTSEYQPKDKPVKSIWDIFEEETPVIEETTQQAVEETSSIEEEKSEIINEQAIDNEIEQETKQEVEAAKKEPETILIESQSIVDVPLEIKIAEINPEEFSKVFDEDFRKTILEDLAKSEQRKKEKGGKEIETITTKEKEELQRELNESSGVEPVSEIMEFDLSEMHLDKPSEILAKELIESGDLDKLEKRKKKGRKEKKQQIKEPTEQTASSSESDEVEEQHKEHEQVTEQEIAPTVVDVQSEQSTEEAETIKEPPTEETEEKKRRKVPVFWFVFVGLIVLALLIGGYFTYLNLIKKPNAEKEIANKETEINKPKVPEIQKKEKPKEEVKTPEPIQTPIKEEAKATTDIQKEKPEPPRKIVSEKTIKEKIPQVKGKPTPVTEKPKPIRTEKKFASKFSSINKTKKVKIVEVSPETKTTFIPQSEFSIEIFSTTEIEEAIYWVNQLNQKGINAYIKPYRFRNINHYKVRIGKFSSLDEAKNFARELGFKNFWIDRVK